jgi:amino acid transporter
MTETASYEVAEKGLKPNAVGFWASVGVGLASTAPAYSLAATLGFVVIAVGGVAAPLIVILAFIPMFLCAWAIKEMNAVDPDCGTSFTWAWRAIGPRTGWFAGGWGTIASDFLAMASYSQIAGQYFFLLIGAKAIGADPTSVWVLLVGIGWIVGLTWICYIGIEISARLQVALVVVEVIILLLLGVVALAKVIFGGAPSYHIDPSWSWLSPSSFPSFSAFASAMLLMVFIYWGWDTTTSINEETSEPGRIPGIAGVISTFILLGTYFLLTLSVQSYAGVSAHTPLGLANPANSNDVLSVLGTSVFGTGVVGTVLTKLLLFMILTSAAATTQTTILPNARTMLSMSFHKALPKYFGRVHPRFRTPTTSTISFAVASIVFYLALNFVSGGGVLADAVTATVFFAAVYLGISSAACAWHFRDRAFVHWRDSLPKFWVPLAATVMLYLLVLYNLIKVGEPDYSYTTIQLPIFGQVGTALFIVVVTAIIGLICMETCRRTSPQFFTDKAMRYGPSLTELGHVVPVRVDDEGPI